MSAYLFNAPAGTLGDVSRMGESNIEPAIQGSQFSAYGQPAKFNGAGQIVPFAGGETAADFQGLIARTAPAISGNFNQGLNDTVPWLEMPQGFLVRGYEIVKCAIGTPVRGGIVYIRIVAAVGKAIGDLEATADGVNNIALSLQQAEWAVNGKDASGLTEIRIKG